MKEQWTKIVESVKSFWGKLSKKAKVIGGVAAGLVLLTAVVIVVVLNSSPSAQSTMVALYPSLTQDEALQVYNTLQNKEEGLNVTLDSKGQVLVAPQDKDRLLLEMAQDGFHPTTPTYGTFSSNSSFTQTELEKKQWLLYQTQDLLVDTINSIEGVKNTRVLISMPEDNNYVWKDGEQNGKASVTITMNKDSELTPDRVIAVKNLVAYSVPKLTPENVKVIDGSTGLDMENTAEQQMSNDRLEYERNYEQNVVNKIKELLYPIYNDGVTAVATAQFNYDVSKEESKELIPQEDGTSGFKTSDKEQFEVGGTGNPVGDIVGEENNTDTPVYANLDNAGENGENVGNYNRDRQFDYGQKITQTERGTPTLRSLSVTVLVPDPEFTDEERDRYTEMISKGVGVETDSLTVESYEVVTEPEEPTPEDVQTLGTRVITFVKANWIIFAIAAVVLILLLVALLLVLKKLKKKKRAKLAAVEAQAEDIARNAQEEIEAHKKALAEAAGGDSTETAITNEVREFAKQNPEITAQLIRTMLKEEE